MSYGKLDDRMPFHEKIVLAGNEAVGAWARMIAWSCGNATDGWIPIDIAKAITGRPGLVRHMVECKLLDAFDAKTGTKMPTTRGQRLDKNHLNLRVHDHLDWNISAEEAKQLSEVRSAAGKKGAEIRHGKSHNNSVADPDPDPDLSSSSSTNSDNLTFALPLGDAGGDSPRPWRRGEPIYHPSQWLQASANLGIAITPTIKERAAVARVIRSGKIEAYEYEPALEVFEAKKAVGGVGRHPACYLMGVIEGQRRDAVAEEARPSDRKPSRTRRGPRGIADYTIEGAPNGRADVLGDVVEAALGVPALPGDE